MATSPLHSLCDSAATETFLGLFLAFLYWRSYHSKRIEQRYVEGALHNRRARSAPRGRRTEIGSRRSGVRDRRSGDGDRGSEIGDRETEIGRRRSGDGDRETEIGRRRSGDGDQRSEVRGRKSEDWSKCNMYIKSAKDLDVYQKAYTLSMEIFMLSKV